MESKSDLRVLERISAVDIVRAWRSDLNIDVSHLFEGIEDVRLVHDTRNDQLWFDPPVTGDNAFYQALRKFSWYHPKRKLEHAFSAEFVSDDDLVLDVGAGNGAFATYIPEARYIGLEQDDIACRNAKTAQLLNKSMSDWRQSPDFEPADIVTSFQVLEHVTDPKGFIEDMAACATDNGQIIISVPDIRSYLVALPDFVLNMPPHHVSWWTEEVLGNVMRDAGLHVEKVLRFPVEPWEKRIYWMSRLAAFNRPKPIRRFGRQLHMRKVMSYLAAWPLQIMPIPEKAKGSSMVLIGRKT